MKERGFFDEEFKKDVGLRLLLSQLFCGQAWAAEVHTPCYRNSVDTENSDFDKGEWKYRFTADSGQETVLTEGEKHTFLIINGGLSAEHIIIEKRTCLHGAGALCDALGLQREEVKDMALSWQDNLRGKRDLCSGARFCDTAWCDCNLWYAGSDADGESLHQSG